MNISSFHTHTRLCKHASGDPIDYLKVATSEGCSGLGISDHCPYPDGTWGGSRMDPSQVREYVALVMAAREQVSFPFFWGFECEWHPKYESWYRDFLRAETGAEYLVYGSHWVEVDGCFEYIPDAGDHKNLKPYVDLTLEGLSSGLFDVFAHPDIFLAGFPRWDADLKAASKDIIAAAIAARIPMEVNGLGLTKPRVAGPEGMRPPYPVREFLDLAASEGAVLICNSDAHRPQDALAQARNAETWAYSRGIPTVDAIEALAFAKGTARA